MDYKEFINNKLKTHKHSGFKAKNLNKNLFDFQKHIVKKACEHGKYAIFADCGLGKTLMQLEWASQVNKHTKKPVLILAPLAVSAQTINEGEKFGIKVVKYDGVSPIQITNYEQIDNIDIDLFEGVVLDESSILKNFTGKLKNKIIDSFENYNYKLACTATPAPNAPLEIGNHSEFLNVLKSQDMRAIYFTTDKSRIKKDKYVLKGHSKKDFYGWISSWASVLTTPSDIGYDSKNYELPELNILERKIETDDRDNGKLFNDNAVNATNFNQELRLTKVERMSEVAEIVNNSKENFIIWIKQNEEADYLKKLIPDAVEVRGSDKPEIKEQRLLDFAQNKIRVLITKAKIAQFGMNFQNCNNQIFASLDFSFESLYQAVRRSYRFGQKNEVNIYIITTDTMTNVINTINEKNKEYEIMMNEITKMVNNGKTQLQTNAKKVELSGHELYLGDCVETLKTFEENSIDYSFSSPPFGALYVFSDNPKDMSNVKNNDEFLKQYEYLIKELYRVMKQGRLVSIHIMQSTTLLGRDGFYSIVDLRGDLIRLYQKHGFYFHAECMIRKDPKTAAIRTKNHQLMHGTTKRDSSIVRPGLADYILTFRKPGDNLEPIKNDMPFDLWCEIAEPVWLDIEESDTVKFREGRDKKDDRHITPTQLKAIRNCYLMWSNKGDTVLSPFSGVASEGVQSIRMDRKYIGIELKESYFELGVSNMKHELELKEQMSVF